GAILQCKWTTSESVSQPETGMTRAQVRFILGSPRQQDMFHAERWDYPCYRQPGYGQDELRKFTVWFENDRLVRWSGDEQPDRQPFQKADSGKEAIQSANAERDAQQAASPGLDNAASPSGQATGGAPQAIIETAPSSTNDQEGQQ